MPRPSRLQPTASLPPYEPPTHALLSSAQLALRAQQNPPSLRKLAQHIPAATGAVTEAAGDINERLVAREDLLRRRRARREREGLSEPDDELRAEEQSLGAMRAEVERLTVRSDEAARRLIDVEAGVEGVLVVLRDLGANPPVLGAGPGAWAGAAGMRRAGRGRRRGEDDEADEEGGDDDDDNEDAMEGVEHGPSSQAEGAQAGQQENMGPARVLKTGVEKRKQAYEAKSQRQRYATHNAYIGFKRIVHDAQHPGEDAPPVPHPDSWFGPEASQTTSSTSQQQRGSTGPSPRPRRGAGAQGTDPDSGSDSDDVAIAREKTSLKCPITLLPFRDPVTSKKCPHSFEREAILSMIISSGARVGGRRRGEGERAVKCPVCEQMLTMADLSTDRLLIRRVKRLQKAERDNVDDNDDADSDDGGRAHRGTQGKNAVPKGSQANAPDELSDDGDDDDGGHQTGGAGPGRFGRDIDGFKEDEA